jgi:hypothetical protein
MEKLCTTKRKQDEPPASEEPILLSPQVTTLHGLKQHLLPKWSVPVRHATMDDVHVYGLKKLAKLATCKKWKSVFDGNGRIRIDRKPLGKPPVVQAFGVKFLVLIEGKYVLTGSDLATRFPWIMAQNKVTSLGQDSPI